MRKKRSLSLLMAILLALSVWMAPPRAAAEKIKHYPADLIYAKFLNVDYITPAIHAEPNTRSNVVVYPAAAESMKVIALWTSTSLNYPDDLYYEVAYIGLFTGISYSGFVKKILSTFRMKNIPGRFLKMRTAACTRSRVIPPRFPTVCP